MISKLWFRFGIPLGSATLLAALLDFALSAYWLLHEGGSFLFFHVTDLAEPVTFWVYYGVVAVLFKGLLSLLLWAFILTARRILLLIWLPLALVADGLLVAYSVRNKARVGSISDEVWFLHVAVFVVLRFYVGVVLLQALRRLLRNARIEAEWAERRRSHSRPSENGNENFSSIEVQASSPSPSPTSDRDLVGELELRRLQSQGATEKKNGAAASTLDGVQLKGLSLNLSPRFLLLEPIGKSPSEIWDFYSELPRLGAAVLVWFELCWNLYLLSTRGLTTFVMRGQMFFMIKEEEIIMRIWRLVLSTIAIVLIFKRRKTLLRFWLIMYFWSLFASLCIFVYVLTDWIYPSVIQVVVMTLMFFGDNVVRFAVIFFILRTTTQPPVLTPPPTEDGESPLRRRPPRSESLKSQGPGQRRNRSASSNGRRKFGTQKLKSLRSGDPEVELY